MRPVALERGRVTLRYESDLPSSTGNEVVVQRLPDGVPSAFGWADQGQYVIRFPGLATFAFQAGSGDIRVVADSSTTPEVVSKLFQTVAVPFALQTMGYEALHASGVITRRGVVAFCGESGSGKSTLAFALARRPGFRLWADDAVVIGGQPSPGQGYVCVNVVQEASLRPTARRFFGETANVEATPEGVDAPLASIVLLDPAPADAELRLDQLSVVDALTGILPHAFCFFVDDGREEQTIRMLVDLAARVPVSMLRLPARFDRLDPALDLLEAAPPDVV